VEIYDITGQRKTTFTEEYQCLHLHVSTSLSCHLTGALVNSDMRTRKVQGSVPLLSKGS